ncbi:hypothetical protein ABBQ38_004623 [Trebouxia sp. C0009 RCD-2024]
MRLFSKVREGTVFDAASQNTRLPAVPPVILQQAAEVAIDTSQILAQANKLKQTAAPGIAGVWTDGSLGEDDGLPARKTRIYIPSSAAVRANTAPAASQSAAAAGNSASGQPVKKKRKGKAERNRLKREAALASSET